MRLLVVENQVAWIIGIDYEVLGRELLQAPHILHLSLLLSFIDNHLADVSLSVHHQLNI
jgi:hypothetical protein